MRYLALVCILLGPQDPADKVKALVEKLGSDELAVREQAQADLIKSGPAILSALRGHLASSEGERKGRLQSIIAKIERGEKVAHLLAPGPTVTLKAKDRPAKEILAEISKQSGVTLEGAGLPEGMLLSLEAERLSLPAAVEELCRRHGGITSKWSTTVIRIVPGPYRPRPHFDVGPFRFIVDGMAWTFEKDHHFSLKGLLVGPPGRLPQGVRLEVDECVDDKGNTLSPGEPNYQHEMTRFKWPVDHPAAPRFWHPVWAKLQEAPALEAQRLTKLRGVVRLVFILGSKKLATMKFPLPRDDEDFPVPDDPKETIYFNYATGHRKGRTLTITYGLEGPPEEEAEALSRRPTWIALHDSKGRRLDGYHEDKMGPRLVGTTKENIPGSITFRLPDGFEPATLDLMEGTDLEEVRIPFDLGEVPLR